MFEVIHHAHLGFYIAGLRCSRWVPAQQPPNNIATSHTASGTYHLSQKPCRSLGMALSLLVVGMFAGSRA